MLPRKNHRPNQPIGGKNGVPKKEKRVPSMQKWDQAAALRRKRNRLRGEKLGLTWESAQFGKREKETTFPPKGRKSYMLMEGRMEK